MASDTLRDRIAAVQQAHHLRIDPNHPAYGYCMCGYNPDADEDDFWWVAHAQHVADAVIRELNLDGSVEPARLQERLDNIGRWLHPGLWGAMDGRRGILLRILAGEQIEPPASARSTDLHSEHRPVMSDDLRTRIAKVLDDAFDNMWNGDTEALADAVIAALGLREEQRSLPDGEGGVSINYKTGERTDHFRPCTRQHRYVTEWTSEVKDDG